MPTTDRQQELPETNTTIPEAIPATMRAIVQRRYGTTDTLSVDEAHPVPAPAAGQVLLAVHAAGVDRGTLHLMTGEPYIMRVMGFGLRRPKHPVPGLDVAGTVVALGDGVTRFAVGDEVFGIGVGTFAEYAVAEEAKLAKRPTSMTTDQAAAATVSGITALQALTDVADVRAGQRVLVIGASGGVGSSAVQIATSLGAEVTGVASTTKLDFVRSLGAAEVIDYTTTDPLATEAAYDVIIDINGRRPLRKLRRALTDTGTVVLIGGENGNRITGGFGRTLRGPLLSLFVSQRIAMLISEEAGNHVDRLADLIAAGVVTPAVAESYTLDAAPAALDDLAAGRVVGKAVVTLR